MDLTGNWNRISDLMQAISIVIDALRVLVLAGDNDLEVESAVRAKYQAQGNNIVTVGADADIAAFDVVAIWSSNRALFAILDAMRHGKPLVCNSSPVADTLIRSGTSGLVVPTGDLPAFMGGLEILISDAGYRSRMGRMALDRFRNSFTRELQTRQVLAMYRSVIQAAYSAAS